MDLRNQAEPSERQQGWGAGVGRPQGQDSGVWETSPQRDVCQAAGRQVEVGPACCPLHCAFLLPVFF